MKVGYLRDRVKIEKYSEQINSYGENIPVWSLFAEVFAEVRTVTGREFLQADKVSADVSHVIIIRYLADVIPAMRIVWNDRIFNISGVIADRTNAKMIQLYVTEKVA